MAAVTICSDFGAQKNKVWHPFHCFPIYFPWSDGTRCHDLRFLNTITKRNPYNRQVGSSVIAFIFLVLELSSLEREGWERWNGVGTIRYLFRNRPRDSYQIKEYSKSSVTTTGLWNIHQDNKKSDTSTEPLYLSTPRCVSKTRVGLSLMVEVKKCLQLWEEEANRSQAQQLLPSSKCISSNRKHIGTKPLITLVSSCQQFMSRHSKPREYVMFTPMCYVKLRANILYFGSVKEKYAEKGEKSAKRSKGIFLWPIIKALLYSGRDNIALLFKTSGIRQT